MWDGDLRKLHNSWKDIPIEHTEELIYHYTSQMGLDGILKNRQLWANDIYMQNDKSEGIYVLSVLKQNIDSFGIQEDYKNAILRQIEKVKVALQDRSYEYLKHRSFIVSFSTVGDELTLWNYYTKNEDSVGYNIAFDTKVLMNKIKIKKLVLDKEINVCYPGIMDADFHHGKVIYNENEQCEIMKKEIEKFASYFIPNDDFCEYLLVEKILWIGNFFKSSYFEHEQEYRLVFFTGTDKEYPDAKEIAMEIEGAKNKNHIEVYYNPHSVLSVTCSPTNELKDVKRAKEYMTSIYPNFKNVNESKIPFRII